MNQCYYLPEGMSAKIYAYHRYWTWTPGGIAGPQGYDTMMARMFAEQKISYYQSVPSLVEHLHMKSEIHHTRSSNRQSTTFIDPEYEGFPYAMEMGQTA